MNPVHTPYDSAKTLVFPNTITVKTAIEVPENEYLMFYNKGG